MSFYLEVDEWLQEAFDFDSTTKFIVSGDFNFVFDIKTDAIGRKQTQQEVKVIDFFKKTCIKFNLIDSFRMVNSHGGCYTWSRNNPMYLRSRLDHIFISKTMSMQLVASNVTPEPHESDHCFLYSEFKLGTIPFGPGILRCNSTLFDCPEIKNEINNELKYHFDDMNTNWDPHLKLDYMKYKLRQIMISKGRIKAQKYKNKLEYCNLEVSSLKKKLDTLLDKAQEKYLGKYDKIIEEADKLKEALVIAEQELIEIKNEDAKRLIFRSRAKWAEEGEKSNKYFLNLLKERQKAMLIRKIVSNGITYLKQDEISKAITNFYKNLYKKQDNLKTPDDTELFKDLPQEPDEMKLNLSKPLTLNKLELTLKTCKESAPGPDGISYTTLTNTWGLLGPLIINAWEHSCAISKTSPSQRLAIITLLEKKGKDKSIIENLRPISLSNCDIKLCTKALATRTNQVLPHILSKTQTGYIPGRLVNDNNRLIEELIDKLNQANEKAYLITLDAQKAFDSVDHKYLINILERFGFPPTYIQYVKMIYNDLQAAVMVNGYIGNTFKIEQ